MSNTGLLTISLAETYVTFTSPFTRLCVPASSPYKLSLMSMAILIVFNVIKDCVIFIDIEKIIYLFGFNESPHETPKTPPYIRLLIKLAPIQHEDLSPVFASTCIVTSKEIGSLSFCKEYQIVVLFRLKCNNLSPLRYVHKNFVSNYLFLLNYM